MKTAAQASEFEIDWLKKWAHFSPKAIAFKDADSGAEYSYAELYYLSCRLAKTLKDQYAITEGLRVSVLATNELETIALFLALQRLGAILVPVNFRLTGREVSHILADSSPSVLIYQKQFASLIEQIDASALPKTLWVFDGEKSLSSYLAEELDAFRNTPEKVRLGQQSWIFEMVGSSESACMILYTSGTTGAPKGAIITNKILHWNSLNTGLRLNLSQSDVNLGFLPFFHTGGWNVLLTPLLHRGARTVLLKKFEANRVLELAAREGVTLLFGVPTTMEMMARSPLFEKTDLSKVRYAIVGGEPMPIELIKIWEQKNIPIRQGFGMTEFGPSVFSLNEEDSIRKIGSIGFPNFYVEAKVVADDGSEVGVDEIGELLLKGPVCTPGYWNNPEATANAIREGWLYTGDLVRRDEEGYYYVVGRKKDMFISGGENVYPVEVEQYLSSHPAIAEVAVIGVPDNKWGEVGKAYVSLKAGAKLTVEELLTYCSGQLAKFKIPKHVEILPNLPKGDSGKILKRRLRELHDGVSLWDNKSSIPQEAAPTSEGNTQLGADPQSTKSTAG